jgi:hypothetical protein
MLDQHIEVNNKYVCATEQISNYFCINHSVDDDNSFFYLVLINVEDYWQTSLYQASQPSPCRLLLVEIEHLFVLGCVLLPHPAFRFMQKLFLVVIHSKKFFYDALAFSW